MAKETKVIFRNGLRAYFPDKDRPDLDERQACNEMSSVGELQNVVDFLRARLHMIMLRECARVEKISRHLKALIPLGDKIGGQ